MRLGAALPAEGWISDYLEAVVPLTDAPVEFALASGLCALSAALGNQIWIESWDQQVYPHLWAILVAPSSFWRKSTAINMAERLLRESEAERVLPSDFSREKLLEELQARPVGMLTLKEFGGFLANISRDYMSGTREMLTELYDGPLEYARALKSKSYVVRRPAITVLGATTLDWLEARVTEGDLRGGFLGRFLFVTATEKAAPKGLTGGMDGIARMHLRDALRALMKLDTGEAKFTPAARQLLEAWISTWEEEVTSSHHSTDLTGFAVRLQTYALKLAMLYQASSAIGDGRPIDRLEEHAVASAIAYCRLLWHNVVGLIDEKIAIGKDAKELRRLTEMVGHGRGIARMNLLKLSKLKARDFDGFLETLVQSGAVEELRLMPADLGLERATNRAIRWIRSTRRTGPAASVDDAGEPLTSPHFTDSGRETDLGSVPAQFTGSESEARTGKRGRSESEASGAESLSDSPLTSPSLSSLSINHESHTRAHAREGGSEKREASDASRSTQRSSKPNGHAPAPAKAHGSTLPAPMPTEPDDDPFATPASRTDA